MILLENKLLNAWLHILNFVGELLANFLKVEEDFFAVTMQ